MLKQFLLDKNFFEIVRGTFLSSLSKVLTLFLGMLINLIISKYYGSEILGMVSVVMSLLVMSSLISVFGIHEMFLKIISKLHATKHYLDIKKLYYKGTFIVLLIGLIISSIFFLNSDRISILIFKNKDLSFIIIMVSFFILIKSFTIINLEVIRALGSINMFAIMQSLPSIIILILLLTFMNVTHYQELPIYIYLCSDFFVLLIGFIYLYKKYQNNFLQTKTISYNYTVKNIFSMSFPMFITSSIFVLTSQVDILILSKVTTLSDVGIYSISTKLALLSIFIISSLNSMMAPKFSQLFHQKENIQLEYLAKKSSMMIFWLTLPISSILIIFGKNILQLFGQEFEQGYIALIILTLAHTANAFSGSNGNFLNMTGYQKKFMQIMLISAIINIIGNLLLIPLYGLNGAAFASFLSIIFWNLYASFFIKRQFGYFLFDNPFKIKQFVNLELKGKI